MKYIVYQTTNIENNKIYIGVHKTKDADLFDGYIGCGIIITNPSTYMNPTTPLQYAVKKYGTSKFRRSILKVYDTAEEAFEMELLLVDQTFINRIDTYNAKLGGCGGSSYSVKINQFDIKGKFLRSWQSIIEAAEFYNISDTAISNASKFFGSSKGYYWSTSATIDISKYSNCIGTVCYKYNLSGKLIDSYNSLTEAANQNSELIQTIERAVKGGYRVGEYYYSTSIYENYTGQAKISLKGKSVYVYSLEGVYITELTNSSEIYKFFDITTTNAITSSLRLKRPYKIWQLSLEKLENLPAVVSKRNISKRVGQYSELGVLIKEYSSITEASLEFGTGVQKVLRGQQKQCKGFIFKYLDIS